MQRFLKFIHTLVLRFLLYDGSFNLRFHRHILSIPRTLSVLGSRIFKLLAQTQIHTNFFYVIVLYHTSIFAANKIPTYRIIHITIAIIIDVIKWNFIRIMPNHILQIRMIDIYPTINHRHNNGLRWQFCCRTRIRRIQRNTHVLLRWL